MVRWIAVGAVLAGACGFQAVEIHVDSGIGSEPVGPGSSDDVVHVGAADEYLGTGDLTIDAALAIDTGVMSLGMALPSGTTFAAASQDGGGPELAILHVRALAIHADVRVLGPRPLVLLADSFELTHTIDASAHDKMSAQARSASSCQLGPPGGGGGALEIYARTRISISGYINAGDAIRRGAICPGIAAPFGSGDTIVLQSPVVDNSGRLTADGEIVVFYRTKVSAGATDPAASLQQY